MEQRCSQNALTIGLKGVGVATHLGRMEGSGSNCTTFDLGTQAVPNNDGFATFVAADGSSITVSYEGTQAARLAGVARVSQTFTVLSGKAASRARAGHGPAQG